MAIFMHLPSSAAVRALSIPPLALLILTCFSAPTAFGQTAPSIPAPAVSQSVPTTTIKSATIEADSEITEKYSGQLDKFRLSLQGYEASINDKSTSDARLKEMPVRLDTMRQDIRTFIDVLRPLKQQSSERLMKIGVSKEGVAEAADLASERARIAGQLAAYESLMKKAEVMSVRAVQIIDAANNIRRSKFSDRILSPADNFYEFDFWTNAPTLIRQRFIAIGEALWKAINFVATDRPWSGAVCLFLPLVVGIGLWAAIRLRTSSINFDPLAEDAYPGRIELGARAAIRIIRRSVPIIVGLMLSYLLSLRLDIFEKPADDFIFVSWSAIGFAWVLFVTNHQLFTPWDSKERLVSSDKGAARQIGGILTVLILVWLADNLFANLDEYLRSTVVETVTRSVFTALSIAALIFLLLKIPLRESPAASGWRMNGWPTPLAMSLGALAFGICVACLLGYAALGRFVAVQVVATGGIVLLMYLSHLAAEHLSAVGLEAAGAEPGDGDHDSSMISLTTFRVAAGLTVDLLILAIGIPAILLQWGFDWVDVRSWLLAAFFGFQIGDYNISIQTAIVALCLLVGGVMFTRVVQRWFLKRSELGRRTDTGVRESVRAALGYLGFAVSAIAAISYLGINFANLAIIAGALSVGIGFGLQSIVNNFVSGLIMLVERPIKTGDWISVGDSDGLVRRISVRATELETLDKQTIIVPNSEFISKPVTNWMYKERIGRISIAVGVSYDSDVEVVERVLLEAAKNNKYVLSRPPSNVVFENFGESSLDFLLRVFISDMEHKVPASSSIRFSIWRALKDAGISIPFPQRDIHVKEIQEVSRISERARIQTVGS